MRLKPPKSEKDLVDFASNIVLMLPVLSVLSKSLFSAEGQLPNDFMLLFQRKDVVRIVYRRQYALDLHCRNGFIVLSDIGSPPSQPKSGRPFLISLQDSFFGSPWMANFVKRLPDGRRVLVAEMSRSVALLHEVSKIFVRDFLLNSLIPMIVQELRELLSIPVELIGHQIQFQFGGNPRRIVVVDVQNMKICISDQYESTEISLKPFLCKLPLRFNVLRLIAHLVVLPIPVLNELTFLLNSELQRMQQQQQQQQQVIQQPYEVHWCFDCTTIPSPASQLFSQVALNLRRDQHGVYAIDIVLLITPAGAGFSTTGLFLPLRYEFARESLMGITNGQINLIDTDPENDLARRTLISNIRQATPSLKDFVSALISCPLLPTYMQPLEVPLPKHLYQSQPPSA